MKPNKISFLGLFGQQNLGNDCTLQAILYHVRKYFPDAEIGCVCTGPEEISARYSISTFPMTAMSENVWPGQLNFLSKVMRKVLIKIPMELIHWVKAFNLLKGTHIFIIPGTGLLVDHTTGPFGYPYYVFKWSILARLHRCKLLIVSMGAGPIYHPLSRWFIKSALSMADYRSYRDSFSKEYIGNIGLDIKNDPVFPDLAFSLPKDIMPECNNTNSRNTVVGVGLIDYDGPSRHQRGEDREVIYRAYIKKVSILIEWFIERKYSVRILIGDVKYDSSVRQDLIDLFTSRGLMCEGSQIISESIFSIEQLITQLINTDIVISPRFHNIILALMLNKPAVSIAYNKKFNDLMAGVEMSEYCQDIDQFDVEKVIAQFIKLEANVEKLKPYIKKSTEAHRRALDKQYSFIFNNV